MFRYSLTREKKKKKEIVHNVTSKHEENVLLQSCHYAVHRSIASSFQSLGFVTFITITIIAGDRKIHKS